MMSMYLYIFIYSVWCVCIEYVNGQNKIKYNAIQYDTIYYNKIYDNSI